MKDMFKKQLVGITTAAAIALGTADVKAQTPRPTAPEQNTSSIEQVDVTQPDTLDTNIDDEVKKKRIQDFNTVSTDSPLKTSTSYHVESDLHSDALTDGETLANELMRTSTTTTYQGLGKHDLHGSFTILNDYQITNSSKTTIPAMQKTGSIIGRIAPQQRDDGWTGSNLVVFNAGNPLDAPYVESSATFKISDNTTSFTPKIQAGFNGQSFDNNLPQETYAIVDGSLDQDLISTGSTDTDITVGSLTGRWGSNLLNDAQTFFNAETSLTRENTAGRNSVSDTEIYASVFSNAGTDGVVTSYRNEAVENGSGTETGITAFGQQAPDGTLYGKAKIAFGTDTDPYDDNEAISPTSYGTGAKAITATLTKPQIFPPKIPHTVQNGSYTAEAEFRTDDEDNIHTDIVFGRQLTFGDVTVGAAAGPSYQFKDNNTDPGVEGVINIDYRNDALNVGVETQIERDGDIEPYLKLTYTPN